jgi:N-methylhydantoinase A/oxoprolinase/acetone carboxylase beta subunit
MAEAELRLGVDVGGTNTDAVLIDDADRLVAKAKVATTLPHVQEGIATAIGDVLDRHNVRPVRVTRAMLGTTHAINAVLERRNVRRVAVVRIGSPLTHAVPPLTTWPADLRAAVSAGEMVVGGGAEYDGRAAAALDEDALARFLAGVAETAQDVAITSVFSPVAPDHEVAAAAVVRRELGSGVRISLSHEIGSVGLLDRENATVLNAALSEAAEGLATAFGEALEARGIAAEPYFAQNDGTLMALEHALRFPVLMIRSGPANSMRGAAHLSGVEDGVVIDVGGTSTDVGVLANGFPRESLVPAVFAGVRMNFRTPDVDSLPFGGGSIVDLDADPPRFGPRSVALHLEERALVFGGDTPTLTDAAVAGGRATLGSQRPDARHRPALLRALAAVGDALVDAIDRVRPSMAPPPLVVVGGAGMLVPERLAGTGEVIRPDHHEVANAIGAAIAPVSGQADRICPSRPDKRAAALAEARAAAIAMAVHAGADPAAVEVVEVEEIPLTYLVDPAIRIRVKAAGPRV